MATENKQTTTSVTKRSMLLEPSFTSERWSDGIYNVEQDTVDPLLYIKEEELLSLAQREERETRSLLFLYQIHYAEAEYKLMQEEFRIIEEKLNQEVFTTEKEVDTFKKPSVPEEKTLEKTGKTKKTAKSSSGSETSETLTPRKSARITSKTAK